MATPRLPLASQIPSEFIETPSGGWSPDIPTWELPPNQAPRLENWQIKDGRIRVRPGYAVTTDLSAFPPSLAAWIQVAPNQSSMVKRLVTTFPVEPRNIHRVGTTPSGFITPVDQAHYEITGNSVTRTAATTVDQVISDRVINFNGSRYALGYTSTGGSVLTFNDNVGSYPVKLLYYPSFGGSPALVASTPIGGFDIYGGFNRIWIAGGIGYNQFIGGTILPSTTSIFFTNPIAGLTNSPSDWTDPVSGLDNVIDIDGDHTDAIVGLASVPAGLIILRENSVFILRGAADVVNSGTVRPVSHQVGCIDNRSIVEQDNKVYFMSNQGWMVTDGTSVQNASGAIQDELYRQIATWTNGVFNGPGAYCTAVSLSDSKILITFGIMQALTTTYQCSGTFSAIYDPATGAWVQVTSQIGLTTGNFLGPVIKGYGAVNTLGYTQIATIESDQLAMSVSGPSSLFDKRTPAGLFIPTIAVWETRSPSLALGARARIQMKRWYMDYESYTGTSQSASLEVDLINRIGLGQLSTYSVTPPQSNTGHRYMQSDDQHEVADLGFRVTMQGTTGGAASVPQADVQGIGLDFSEGSDLRPIV